MHACTLPFAQMGLRQRISLQRACSPILFNRVAQLAELWFRSSLRAHTPHFSPFGGDPLLTEPPYSIFGEAAPHFSGGVGSPYCPDSPAYDSPAYSPSGGGYQAGGGSGDPHLTEVPYGPTPPCPRHNAHASFPSREAAPCPPGPPSLSYCPGEEEGGLQPLAPGEAPSLSPARGGGDQGGGDCSEEAQQQMTEPPFSFFGEEPRYPPSPNRYCPDSPAYSPYSPPSSEAFQGGGADSIGGAAGGTAGLTHPGGAAGGTAGGAAGGTVATLLHPAQETPLAVNSGAAAAVPGGKGVAGEREESKEEEWGLPPLAPGTYFLQGVEEGGSRRYARVVA